MRDRDGMGGRLGRVVSGRLSASASIALFVSSRLPVVVVVVVGWSQQACSVSPLISDAFSSSTPSLFLSLLSLLSLLLFFPLSITSAKSLPISSPRFLSDAKSPRVVSLVDDSYKSSLRRYFQALQVSPRIGSKRHSAPLAPVPRRRVSPLRKRGTCALGRRRARDAKGRRA